MTSDFMPVKSGSCSMNFGLSPVRMPASPDCIAAAAPEVTMAPYPSGSLSISAMRLPAATSSSGTLTKWRPANAITASTSGRIREPPNTVMVPCPLMTVVTPNSSYTFPVAPKPETEAALPPAAGGRANALRPLKIVPTSAPRVLRNVLRFQRSLNAIGLRPLLYVAHYGSDAVNFHQRLAGQSSDSNGSASGPSVRKVSLEHRVHAVVIVQLCQKHGELQNAVHGAAARFHGGLHAFHHHVGVHLDGRSFGSVGFVAA